jgi:hypothetical protein
MNRMQNIWRRGRLFFLGFLGWLAVQGTVFANPPQLKEEPRGGSYVMAYGLVILAIALGLMAVLRPSRRRDRAKPEVYDEIKIKAKE